MTVAVVQKPDQPTSHLHLAVWVRNPDGNKGKLLPICGRLPARHDWLIVAGKHTSTVDQARLCRRCRKTQLELSDVMALIGLQALRSQIIARAKEQADATT